MANLYEILADAQNGQALADLGRQYGMTEEQTQAAVASLLPAISMGLRQATATPEGLGNLLALMACRTSSTAFSVRSGAELVLSGGLGTAWPAPHPRSCP